MSTSDQGAASWPPLKERLVLKGYEETAMPTLIYGTAWKAERTADLVYKAIKAGFRGIDTAGQPKHYKEPLVGEGIRQAINEGIVTRKELYIQTKFCPVGGQDPNDMPYDPDLPITEQVHASIASSLRNLAASDQETPYLDCVVLHSPYSKPRDTLTAYRALSSYVPRAVRHLGISNVTLAELQALAAAADDGDVADSGAPLLAPAVVQNRFYRATAYDGKLRAWCRGRGIAFQSFWTLSANRDLLQHPVVEAARQAAQAGVAEHDDDGDGSAQSRGGIVVDKPVALYALVLGLRGTAMLDGTTDEEHMRADVRGLEAVRRWTEGAGRETFGQLVDDFRWVIGEGGQV